jgi:superfamily II DNA/RNA helicase
MGFDIDAIFRANSYTLLSIASVVQLADMKFKESDQRLNTFQEMPIAPVLLQALEKMEIATPTAVQSLTIPVALNGSDLISVAQTGSGKTLAYALPVLTWLHNHPASRALVMAPSRETAQQVFRVFEELCADLPVTCCLVIGGLPGPKQTSQLKKNPRLIVATPGRMYDHLLTNKLLLQKVEMVVIDEADRMLDMGFAPQLKNIKATMRGSWQTMMFSASFSPAVELIATIFMKEEIFMIRAADAEAPVSSLTQRVYFLDRRKKNSRLLKEMNSSTGGVIVFTDCQDSCLAVGQFLKECEHPAELIHGGLSQGHRDRVVREFRNEEFRILVTTDLLARGLDIPHVKHIVNYDMPFKSEDFLHRIGRTARAGRAGTAVTFVTPADGRTYRKIKSYLVGAEEIKSKDFSFIE